jgi:hypothetical protein
MPVSWDARRRSGSMARMIDISIRIPGLRLQHEQEQKAARSTRNRSSPRAERLISAHCGPSSTSRRSAACSPAAHSKVMLACDTPSPCRARGDRAIENRRAR